MCDIDDYHAACEKPTVKINGKVYTGRLLSVVEGGKYDERWNDIMKDGTPDGKKVLEFCKAYLYEVFPKPRIPWHVDVAKEILKSPAVMQVTVDVFRVQRLAINPEASR